MRRRRVVVAVKGLMGMCFERGETGLSQSIAMALALDSIECDTRLTHEARIDLEMLLNYSLERSS